MRVKGPIDEKGRVEYCMWLLGETSRFLIKSRQLARRDGREANRMRSIDRAVVTLRLKASSFPHTRLHFSNTVYMRFGVLKQTRQEPPSYRMSSSFRSALPPSGSSALLYRPSLTDFQPHPFILSSREPDHSHSLQGAS